MPSVSCKSRPRRHHNFRALLGNNHSKARSKPSQGIENPVLASDGHIYEALKRQFQVNIELYGPSMPLSCHATDTNHLPSCYDVGLIEPMVSRLLGHLVVTDREPASSLM